MSASAQLVQKERDDNRRRDLEHDQERLREEQREVAADAGIQVDIGERYEIERAGDALNEEIVGVRREKDQRGNCELEFADDRDVLLRLRVEDVRDCEADLQVNQFARELNTHKHERGHESNDNPK